MVDHTGLRLALQAVLAAPVPLANAATQNTSSAMLVMLAGFISQVKVNGVVATLIQVVKKVKAPGMNWIGEHTPWLLRGLAALGATLTAAGIHWVFTGGVLTVTGLSLPAVLAFFWNSIQNFLFQHAWYRTLFSSAPPVPEQAPLPGAAEAKA